MKALSSTTASSSSSASATTFLLLLLATLSTTCRAYVALRSSTSTPTDTASTTAGPADCATIAEIACSTEGFETLCSLVDQTGLDSVLGDPTQTLTVFAPNNAAFEAIASIVPTLTAEQILFVLQYHAAPGVFLSTDLTCDGQILMVNGVPTSTVCTEDGGIFQVGMGNTDPSTSPRIIGADIAACNGVVHAIDKVILPDFSTDQTSVAPNAAAVPTVAPVTAPISSPVATPTLMPVSMTPATSLFPVTLGPNNVGLSVCACQPGQYLMRFGFSQRCDQSTITLTGEGVVAATCEVTVTTDDGTPVPGGDTTPVQIGAIQSMEFGQEGQSLGETVLNVDATNFSLFRYTSVSATSTEFLTDDTVPSAVKWIFTGRNAGGEIVQQTIEMQFSSNCDAYPILAVGEQLGWVTFTELAAPPAEACPSVSGGVPAPTDVPAAVPTVAPAAAPIPSPVATPTLMPVSMTPATSLFPVTLGPNNVGLSVCACQPGQYLMTFGFSQTCEQSTITPAVEGVVAATCEVAVTTDDGTPVPGGDAVPVRIGAIQSMEFGQEGQPLGESVLNVDITNFSLFRYTSVSATSTEFLTDDTVPSAVKWIFTGRNAGGEIVQQTIEMQFSSNCDAYPILAVGEQLGWVTLTELTAPPADACPSVP